MLKLTISVFVVMMLGGCASRTPAPSTAQAAPPLPAGVTTSSTPTEVANVALSLVAAGDQDSFAGLIAAERVASDMQAITRGKENFEELRQEGVGIATRSIYRSVEELTSPRVSRESIDDERATCTIEGTRNGNPAHRELFMVREDGYWKLVPSHR